MTKLLFLATRTVSLASVLAPVAAAVLVPRWLGFPMSGSTEHERLWALWGGAAEVVLNVDGQDVWMQPRTGGGESLPFPGVLREHSAFALTAFDPPGAERSLAENTEMNGKLFKTLQQVNPQPLRIFRSFGFDISSSWREDGFVVVFDASARDAARSRIVDIATRFDQGAIFEYSESEEGAQYLVRTTVPATSQENAAEQVTMVRIPAVSTGDNPLLERPWAGPSELK